MLLKDITILGAYSILLGGSYVYVLSCKGRLLSLSVRIVCVIGAEVQVKPECVILNSIVLENKTLSRSYHNDILL
jgi:hypothetical protein